MKWLYGSGESSDEPLLWRASLLIALIALVCVRSFVFMRFGGAHFDSDQAIFGLMAKDFAQGRVIPGFMYGQRYLLPVSVWFSAPLYLLLGSDVVTLKLPTFLMNVATVLMLWTGLRREPGMSALGTALASLPFAMPGVVTSSRLIEHAGGNIEPFVFTLAMFLLRGRPIWLGLCVGIGFLNREFSAIGLIALLIVDALTGKLRERWRARALALGVAGLTAWLITLLGARAAEYHGERPAIGSPAWENCAGFFGQQLPALLGGLRQTLHDYNITSTHVVGHWQLYALFAGWFAVVVFAFLRRLPTPAELDGMSFYLVLVGAGQAASFMLFTPSPRDPMLIRYILLVLFLPVGVAALGWRRPIANCATILYVLVAAGWNLSSNLRLIGEYRAAAPVRDLDRLATELTSRGVHYLRADYWAAYDVTWTTDSQIIASPDRGQGDRIYRYHALFDAHRDEVYRLSNGHCKHGTPILRWYLCAPRPKKQTP